MAKSHDEIWDQFNDAVNMTPKELKSWLDTDESKSVGDTGGDGESTGHESGRKILDIKDTKKADLSDDQWAWMNKVVGYVNRHCAQVPKDPEGSKWEYSLKNWGHDPMKKGGCAN